MEKQERITEYKIENGKKKSDIAEWNKKMKKQKKYGGRRNSRVNNYNGK